MARSRSFIFREAVALVPDLRVIVELGTIRWATSKARLSMGWSTLAWLDTMAEEIHSVDTSSASIAASRRCVRDHRGIGSLERIRYHHKDGLLFLQEFSGNIDLLYIDGPGREGSKDCVRETAPRLLPGAVILLDDCDMDGPPPAEGRRTCVPIAEALDMRVALDSARQIALQKY